MKNKKILFLLISVFIATFGILYYINTPKMISEVKKEEIIQRMLVENKASSVDELVANINVYNSKHEKNEYMFISSHSYSYIDKDEIICKLTLNHEIGSEPYKVTFYDKKGRLVGEYIDITNTNGSKLL